MHILRRYFAATFGNLLKYYDQSIYGCLVPFLAPLFFPHEDPIYSLLAGYALLPLGLIAKPLGAFIFGRLGDRLGRKISLSITLIGMGISTCAIGFLPTFAEAGWISPVLLSFLRLLQNFFAAGETPGGALFLLEETKLSKRGFVSSLYDASGILGALIAALASTLVAETAWRSLFWLGGLSGMVGLILRKKSFVDKPFISTYTKWTKSDWGKMLSIASVSGFIYANYYLLSTFLNGFLPLVSSISRKEALALNSLLLAVDFFLLPCFGWLSLKISQEKLIFAAVLAGALFSCPLFFLLEGATLWTAAFVRIALTTIGVCLSAPYHAWVLDHVPPDKRFSISAMASAIGGRLIGAPAPVIGLWLYHKTGWVIGPSFVLIASATLAMIGIWHLQRSRALQKILASKNLSFIP